MKHIDMIITGVDAVTVRDVAGAGSQAELLIRTKVAGTSGTLAIRLVARRGRLIRLIDLRPRDRKKRTRLVEVPMTEVMP